MDEVEERWDVWLSEGKRMLLAKCTGGGGCWHAGSVAKVRSGFSKLCLCFRRGFLLNEG